MLNPSHDPIELNKSYVSAGPFPHIVIDNFLQEGVANALADRLESQDISSWYSDHHSEQVNKWWMPDTSRLAQDVSGPLTWFNSQESLGFFEKLTGVPGLIPDDSYLGGGVHVSTSGGKLGIHADFNLHPRTGHHRRLNALLFLNRNWDPSWGGQLELWDEGITSCQKMIDPLFNRLAIFNVTDKSFHGVPRKISCPPDRRRISLALYYYTEDRPEEEKGPFHWASWKRPKDE